MICFNNFQRGWLNATLNSIIICNTQLSSSFEPIKSIKFIAKNLYPKKGQVEITDEMIERLKYELVGIPINAELELIGCSKKVSLIPIIENTFGCQVIALETEIKIISTDKTIVIETNDTKELFNGKFNFVDIGVGGLDKQFDIIFRRAFLSRLIPDKILKNLGVNHVRGLMLYGPPGCGKTLIARQIGKILNCEEPKIVSGPSLLSSYHGKSEENIRDLFKDAFADKQNKKLHLIILDEFDAIARKRGSLNDSGISDKLVNQFLSMIDGPESLNNILLIALTNRLELLDEALLRPGRFEIQIEIGLPDQKGRLDILHIHTNKMKQTGFLDTNVDLKEIAEMSTNFTGAELEALVKNAVSFTISKDLDPENLHMLKNINPIVTQVELVKSTKEIKPQFGTISKQIEIITSRPFTLYSNEYEQVYNDILQKISNLNKGNVLSILIQGDRNVGKTTMACQIAKKCMLNCLKFVNSESLLNMHAKENQLYDMIYLNRVTK